MSGVGWLIAVQIALIVVVMMEAAAIRRTLRSQTNQMVHQMDLIRRSLRRQPETPTRGMETILDGTILTTQERGRGKDATDD